MFDLRFKSRKDSYHKPLVLEDQVKAKMQVLKLLVKRNTFWGIKKSL